ncbi:restriction endonuclease subunit S [Nostoc sp.]|uniref:restriction endonuclease subunit S n=1 Tax=Nostoc sp. TaxID=1180 RepID=UPI002FF97D4D
MGEELYELPNGWVWATVGEISKINPRLPELNYSDDLEVSFLPMKSVEAKTGRLDLSEIKQYCQVKKGYTPFIDGDIILAKITPCFENGKVAIVQNLKNGIGFGSTEFHVFRLELGIYNKYLLFYFCNQNFIKDAQSNMAGTAGQLRVPADYIRNTVIPFPPLPEQYRIVAKVEELFTQLDAGVGLLKKVKAKLKRYRQAVLKAAVEGNLTAYWRTAHQGELEPASVLLDRILKQRREKWEAEQLAKMKAQGKTPKDDSWKLKYKEPVAPDTSDLPDLPDGWCWASLQMIADVIDPNPSHRMPKYVEAGIPFISTENFSPPDSFDFSIGKKVLQETLYQQRRILKIEEGDFVLSRIGTIGKTRFLPISQDYCISHALVVIKTLDNSINKRFLRYVISSNTVLNQAKKGVQSVGVPDLGMAKIRCFAIPLIPFDEQNKILEEIEDAFSIIDQLEKTIDTNLKRAERLRQSILKQAFEGQLVPQDPKDEPAEKLLERIQAEKAKQVTTKTKKKTKSQIKSPTQLALPLE